MSDNVIDITPKGKGNTTPVKQGAEPLVHINYSIEAERAILGSCIIDKDGLNKAINKSLKPEDFYTGVHRTIYEILLKLHHSSIGIDLLTVHHEIQRQGLEERLNSPMILIDLTNGIANATNIEFHCAIVIEKCIARKLEALGRWLIQYTAQQPIDKPEKDPFELAETTYNLAQRLLLDAQRNPLKTTAQMTIDAISKIEQTISGVTQHGMMSGLYQLDRITLGFHPAHVYLVGARPGMGKSIFALKLARNIAVYNKDKVVVLFSLEMTQQQVMQRLISMETGIDLERIISGKLDTNEIGMIPKCLEQVNSSNLIIDDSASLTATDIIARCRKAVMDSNGKPLGMVLIDYIGKIKPPKGMRKYGTKEQEVSAISECLREMAKELNVPVVEFSQLSREVEKRPDKHPQLSDLRDSGSLEQDAHVVMFLYRDEYYGITTDANGEPTKGKLDVIVAKNRDGRTGTAVLQFHGDTVNITNFDTHNNETANDKPQFQPSLRFDYKERQSGDATSEDNGDAPF